MPIARICWTLVFAWGLLGGTAGPRPAAGREPPPPLGAAGVAARHRHYKTLEHEILLAGAGAREARWRRALESWREPARRQRLQGLASRPPRHPTGPIERSARRTPRLAVAGEVSDHRMNDITTDMVAGSTQSEVTIAALGDRLVAAWNDGDTAPDGPAGIGWGWSVDGGDTWSDGGVPPRAGGVSLWTSDPVLTVNERTGVFHLAALAIAVGPSNAIATVEGRFEGTQFVWSTPTIVRTVRDTLPDKPWIAADSLTGNLHLSYTTFFRIEGRTRDAIEYQVLPGSAGAWSRPVTLSGADEQGLVQGSRPAVGPDGEVHVVWKTVDTSSTSDGRDYIRARTSRDGGASFGPRVDAAAVYSNFASGAPGFNRGNGISFPSIAVDRSTGPWRGRVYVGWHECLDFYDDPIGGAGPVSEVEPNDNRAGATPFVLGDVLRGDAEGFDLWRFTGARGQTLIVHADSLADSLDVALRLWCADLETQLAFSAPVRVVQRFVIFTLPEDGTYFLGIAGTRPGEVGYRLATGIAGAGAERGRDHRDAFVATSDDGVAWGDPTRVNDEPPWFDDWLPEVAVSPDGTAWYAWYDWRDSPPGACGGFSSLHLARSDDGGGSWRTLGPVSSELSAWSLVAANLAPNQGDYLALFAGEHAVYPSWSDGRSTTPDAWMAIWPAGTTSTGLALVSADATPDRVSLVWRDAAGEVAVADVERRREHDAWRIVGRVTADGEGLLAYVDTDVESGVRYAYRLAAADGAGWHAGEVEVVIPLPAARLAIERVHPNPASSALHVAYALPLVAPASIELIDPVGRRVRTVALPAVAGRASVDLGAGPPLPAGVYVIRLTQAGRSASAKVAVVR